MSNRPAGMDRAKRKQSHSSTVLLFACKSFCTCVCVCVSLTEPLSTRFLRNSLFSFHVSLSSQSLKQLVSKAVSHLVPLWLKHYLRGFATLFLKRSDILSQLPPLSTGKLKMPQSPQATRFIYLHTY